MRLLLLLCACAGTLILTLISHARSGAAKVAKGPNEDDSAYEQTSSASVGICVTGLLRGFLSSGVQSQFQRHLIQPLEAAGTEIGIFVVVVKDWANETRTPVVKRAVEEAYFPTDLYLMPLQAMRLRCSQSLKRSCHEAEGCNPGHWTESGTRYNLNSAKKVLTQWLGIRESYRMVLRNEKQQARRYRWLLRTRTDLLFFEPVRLTLPLDYVYVPFGGMSPSPKAACTNDHIFLCPRGLCRAYFELVELWDSEHCIDDAIQANQTARRASIFARRTTSGRLLPQGEPQGRFVTPKLPFEAIDAEWYFFARYNPAPAHVCTASPANEPASCCGLIREFRFKYALVRRPPYELNAPLCDTFLAALWRGSGLAAAENEAALTECKALSNSSGSTGQRLTEAGASSTPGQSHKRLAKTTITPPWPGVPYTLVCPENVSQARCDLFSKRASSDWMGEDCFEPEQDTAEVLNSFLAGCNARGCSYVDIGCNVDYFALQAAALGSQVACYEPTPMYVEAIQRSRELNRFSPASFHVHQAAVTVSDQHTDGDAGRTFSGSYNPCRVVQRPDIRMGYTLKGATFHAPFRSISRILSEAPQPVTLLKIDIDLNEGALLHEVIDALERKVIAVETILVEIGDPANGFAWDGLPRGNASVSPRGGDLADLHKLNRALGYDLYRVNVHVGREIYDWRGQNVNNATVPQLEGLEARYGVRTMRKLERVLPSLPLAGYASLMSMGISVLATRVQLAEPVVHHTLDLRHAKLHGSAATSLKVLNRGNPSIRGASAP